MRPEQTQPRPLSELARMLGPDAFVTSVETAGDGGAQPAADPGATAISGITHDSRAVRPGDLYAALPGSRAHGADFSAQAAASGAAAVLTDPTGYDRAAATRLPVVTVADPRAELGRIAAWVYGSPGDDLLLIGTTGTSGKTTVTYLVDSGLRAAGSATGLIGTVETRVGGARVAASLTTPEATDLHGLFARMRDEGVGAGAMEVSSHALALGRVAGAHYDVAVFTNLSQDHLDFHSDLRAYFDAKAQLFTPSTAASRWSTATTASAGCSSTRSAHAATCR